MAPSRTYSRHQPFGASRYVWCDATGLGRNVFVLFRRTFTLASHPGTALRAATLHVFADTRYRLWVNGEIVAYGPARFLPTHPEYDTIDLRPWLRRGRNALLIEANSFGDNSFESMPSIGGFIAAGIVRTATERHDLRTPGEWRMQRAAAWDADAPLYSFAQSPVEIKDERLLPPAVQSWRFDDRAWARPVVVTRQDAWGALRPRSVPMLTMDLQAPERVLVNSALADADEIVGARATAPKPAAAGTRVHCCYATHIYSPVEQDVTLGLYWGPHYLDGVQLQPATRTPPGPREDYPVHLRAGWNFLYGEPEFYGVYVATMVRDVFIALPNNKRLVAAAEPDRTCPHTLLLSDGVTSDVLRAAVRAACGEGTVPTRLAQLPKLPTAWQRVPRGELLPSPARLVALDTPIARAVCQPMTVSGLTAPGGQDWVVLFDFGGAYLGHAVLDVEAPAGTVIDVAYDERLRPDGLLDMYRTNPFVHNADRFVTAGGRTRIEAFRPRGGRYLQLTVRQARAPVTLHRVQLRRTLCPVTVEGAFVCSDPVFNWTWSAGLHTLLTVMEDTWNADAWRERGLYLGDTYVIHNATTTFWREHAFIQQTLRLWARGQYPDGQIRGCVPAWLNRPSIDYTLIWVLLLYDYVQQTADLTLLRELWPNVARLFASRVWQEGPHGLWTGDTGAVFVDWTTTPEMKTGENGVLNAFRYAALRCAAELADLLQEHVAARQYSRDARRVKRAFQALWDARTRRFAAALHGETLFDGYAAHTNVLALLYGLADRRQAQTALAYVKHCLSDEQFLSPTHIELYFHKYALEMLYERGEVALAEHIMRRTWGLMKNRGAWAIWEDLYRGLENKSNRCIGWGTTPMIIFARRVLGVRPAPLRPREVLIAPTSATLTWARGTVAHPHGPIDVEWRIRGEAAGRRLEVTVSAPTTLTLRVAPEGLLARLPLTTRVITKDSAGGARGAGR